VDSHCPAFNLSLLRVNRACPTLFELRRTVDWPIVPRAGEGVDITDLVQEVESRRYSIDGSVLVILSRVAPDDLGVKQLERG